MIVVPFGMAVVGVGIGDGREAFGTPGGQLAVLVAFAMMAGCWVRAAKLLKLPEKERAFIADEAVEAS
jgi:tight adherence protein B